MSDFLSLGISQAVTNELRKFGVASPTPIQEKAIPSIIEGRDIMAQAQTGTGKTFAFVLPILESVKRNSNEIQALIVTPTRELAIQITEEFNKLIEKWEGVNVLAVYGGQDIERQLKKLRTGKQIVVGTPGRLLDHIRRGTIDLSDVSFLVLDEADQMLHIGFLGEVEDIIKETPESRQTMLFSATLPAEIRNLAGRYMRDPKYIQIEKTQGPAANVKQIAIHTTDRAKQATLIQLIETHRPFLAVIFCRTKRRVSKLYDALKANGYACDELHGDLSQAKREQVIKRFKEAEIQLLIATDVAARGLDVEGVTHVFNYDIPQDAESYIHRIGRTGRAGMRGLAITLYSSADRPTLDLIEKAIRINIHKQNLGNEEKEHEDGRSPRQSDNLAKTSARNNKPSKKNLQSGARNKNQMGKKQPGRSLALDQSKKSSGKGNQNTQTRRKAKRK
ncbi:DEAD/DEAH box helicase [Neobacillus dielmonensis]|uniref:DEAD/DEAH box helicase n=1 Tax=Neobacillus dielmonensis TaxID=1347369 RepID=UPI0005A888F5|nr:DEAD/DEAH box helicase [Neobacillus dielmonensis]